MVSCVWTLFGGARIISDDGKRREIQSLSALMLARTEKASVVKSFALSGVGGIRVLLFHQALGLNVQRS